MTHDKPAAREWPKEVIELARTLVNDIRKVTSYSYYMTFKEHENCERLVLNTLAKYGQTVWTAQQLHDAQIEADEICRALRSGQTVVNWPKRAEMLQNIHDRGAELWNEITAALDYAYKDGVKEGALRSGGDAQCEINGQCEKHSCSWIVRCLPEHELKPGCPVCADEKRFTSGNAEIPHPDSCPPRESETLRTDSCPPRESGTGVGLASLPSVGPSSEPPQQGMVERRQCPVAPGCEGSEHKRRTSDVLAEFLQEQYYHHTKNFQELADATIKAFPALSRPAVTGQSQISFAEHETLRLFMAEISEYALVSTKKLVAGEYVTVHYDPHTLFKSLSALLHGGK